MSAQDTREFLEDLLLRYDAGIDLSEGGRAQTEIIEPVLARIGIDPIDEETGVFIVQRIQQAFPDLAISAADDITDVLIDPARVLLEPIIREVKLLRLRGSLRNSELMSEDEVDALFANFFQSRRVGGFSRGVVRAYFSSPQTISISQINLASTRGGLRYVPARPQQITAEQMLFNTEGSEYYFDINYIAERQGDEYNVEAGEVRSINGLPAATRVTNLRRFRDGAPRETTAEFEARVGASISDKTLTVARGVIRTLTDAFGSLRHTFVVGYRDPEMKRDIIKGGGLGPIPDPDALGVFFGTGQPLDDLDGDFLTPVFETAAGFFVSRLAAVGQDPQSWFLSLVYQDGGLQVRDVRITEVLSDSTVRLEIELPTTLAPGSVTWALRQRKLTLSDIPGGIVFPDTAEGTLDLPDDQIHVGGRTDVYVAGGSDSETALLQGISDAEPLARGRAAETAALNDVVSIADPGFDITAVRPGMSLVLEEGVDNGSYRILSTTAPDQVRIDTEMTGTQNDLSWRIVDEIDVELTDPKDIKAVGSDVVTVAGNPNIVTLSGLNFRDVNVVDGDILELRGDPALEGDYLVTEVNATTLTVSPAPARTVPGVAFRIFRRSEAVQAPIIRIRSMELVDSAGAPVGTAIPYRDPVLAVSNGFGNEGAGLLFDDRVITGLVLGGIRPALGETYGGGMYFWGIYDPDALWRGPTAGEFLLNVAPGSYSAAALSAVINADPDIMAQGISTTVLSDRGYDFVAFITGARLVRFGPSSLNWGITAGYSSACVRAFPTAKGFVESGVSSGDLLEVYQGNSAPLQTRTLISPVEELLAGFVSVGSGPIGPRTTSPTGSNLVRLAGLYNNTVLNPDINARARIARPSVGSARTYFLAPTSAEFDHLETVFESSDGLRYRPDPENTRVLLPPVPSTELPSEGAADEGLSPGTFVLRDTERNFLQLGTAPGDLLDLLYQPIFSSGPLPGVGTLAVSGLALRLRLRGAPFVTVAFATNLTRQEVVDFINERVGEDVASLEGTGELRLQLADGLLEIDENSTILGPDPLLLFGQPMSTEYSQAGTYIVSAVADNELTLSPMTALEPPGPSVVYPQENLQYRIRRHVQRISSTEMRDNTDATGMFFADVELIALAPGDQHNIQSGVPLEVSGHRADGYRLRTDNPVLSFSRAETLWAEMSRTILLPGSTDSPEEYVQLSRQSVLVTYDRSELVDEIQSFVDSDSERVTTQDLLVRHLRPHYVNIAWAYVGGSNEPEVIRALRDALDDIAPGEELEVSNLVKVLTARGASSVYSPDPSSRFGRREPVLVTVYHDEDRRVRAAVITDVGESTRLARWIADNVSPRRLSVSGLR